MAKILKCEIIPYQLQFIREAKTSRDTMQFRDIWTVKLYDNFGRDGFGEIAPLKGLSRELELDFEAKLIEVSQNISKFLENKDLLIEYPSILFGIESAWLSYRHRDFVFYNTPFTRSESSLPFNALVWMGDFEYMKSQVQEILKKEVRCIKIKIGGLDFEKEIELLEHIRKYRTAKTLEIRLDANGSFSETEAMEKLNTLAPYDIHSIEQPIAANQWVSMAKLIQESPIPIALDEELIGKNAYLDKFNLLRDLLPHYIVLKPSLHGGLRGSEEWIFIASQFNIKWWATSALESNIGLNVIAQWVSQHSEAYNMPQGLGTGQLYSNNFPTHLMSVDYEMFLKK